MRAGIWQEFDGYQEIVADIEAARRLDPPPEAAGALWQAVERLHPRRLELVVAETTEETPEARTLRLVSPTGCLPPFQAGQYICLQLEIGAIRTARPYSISSPPNQRGYYEITVKRVPGGLVSGYLVDEVRAGDRLAASGPAGHFHFNPLVHAPHLVCLAGGSGITPFMSMIRQIVDCGLPRRVTLLYGNRTDEAVIFHDELQRLSERCERIRYVPVIEAPSAGYTGACGQLAAGLIREVVGELTGKSFFVCGPPGMYDFCLPELEQLGVPRRHIRREVYGAPADIWRQPGWPEQVAGDARFSIGLPSGERIPAVAGESVLVALEKAGRRLPSLCRSGECSACRVKLLAGRVFQPAGVPVRRSDRARGWIHACAAYPLSDLEVLV